MKIRSLILATAILLGSNTFAQGTDLTVTVEKDTKFKIIPVYGVAKIRNDYVDFNSKVSPGIALDFMLAPRFSVGLNFNYSKFDLYDDNYVYTQNDMDLHQYNLGLVTKFFVLPTGVIRPFIGTGINYGHNILKYGDNNVSYSDAESLKYGTVSGMVMAGSEIRFSSNVGLLLDIRYMRDFVSGLNKSYESESYYYNGLYEMEDLEYDMRKSHTGSINLGLIISI